MYAGVDARVGLRFKINIPQHYRSQLGPTIRYSNYLLYRTSSSFAEVPVPVLNADAVAIDAGLGCDASRVRACQSNAYQAIPARSMYLFCPCDTLTVYNPGQNSMGRLEQF